MAFNLQNSVDPEHKGPLFLHESSHGQDCEEDLDEGREVINPSNFICLSLI